MENNFRMFMAFMPMIVFLLVIFVIVIANKNAKKRKINDVKDISLIRDKYKKFYDELSLDPEFKKFQNNKVYNFFKTKGIFLFLGMFLLPIIFTLFSFIDGAAFFFPIVIAPIVTVGMIAFIVIAIMSGHAQNKVSKVYKDKIFRKFLSEYYPGYYYDDTKGLAQMEYRMKPYVSYYNRYYSENLFDYKLKDKYAVKFSELKTVHESRDSDGDTHRTTTFQGLAGYVIIDSNKLNNTIFIGHNSKSNIKLDNEEFEKIYNVHSDNEIEAYKFLSPTFMERLIKLDDIAAFDFLIEKEKISFRVAVDEFFEIYNEEDVIIKSLDKYDTILKTIEDTLYNLIKEIEEK